MQSFLDLDTAIGLVPFDVVSSLRATDIGRGREAFFRDKVPDLLTELASSARVASITASSAIEGVFVRDQSRAVEIIEGHARVLRTRSEQELAGYRLALDYLYQERWQPLNVGLILHIHRLLYLQTDTIGGTTKSHQNVVVDRNHDGTVVERFRPVSPAQTMFFLEELVCRFNGAVSMGRHHPILIIGLFVLDLLTIHPFTDGNGRVTRALTNGLVDNAGYGVTRCVSLEGLIAQEVDDYYASLLASTHGWHTGAHDPWPWLRYFTDLMRRAYDSFLSQAASEQPRRTKRERARDYVTRQAAPVFRIADIRAALPGISDQTIRLALEDLKHDGLVISAGTGRNAMWRRTT
jgi:Fic family protein